MKSKLIVLGALTLAVNTAQAIHNAQHVYCVILAGGVGERLWPLSRQSKPKQLLAVGQTETLLEQSIDRVRSIVPQKNIRVCTTQQHTQGVADLVGDSIGNIIIEPGSRNTGPAILLSCCEIYEKDPQAVIVFLPADPFIPTKDTHIFSQFLEHAIDFVTHNDRIALFGAKPTYAATGYGYIEFDDMVQGQSPFPVKKFHEKPSLARAQEYIQSKTMLWNIGMFCAKASVFIDEFKQLASEMYDGVVSYRAGSTSYDAIKSDSIDYAVMEKSSRVSVLPVDFSWCDVGNIEIFLSIKNVCGGLNVSNVFETESHNNLVDVPNKLVALIGVDDLCIVETDHVLLITKRDEAEKVRAIVKQLKQKELTEYL
ncbi:MAG: mannose-1-phosphate guanylyltransferase [Candidatus Dependentiae bacterium]|nr:mannose-1-phosphate guanylyltransferase [Candidatus Dependentiae bacterium]